MRERTAKEDGGKEQEMVSMIMTIRKRRRDKGRKEGRGRK